MTEQAWVNFIDILQLVPAQTRDIALKTLFTQAEKEKKVLYISDFSCRQVPVRSQLTDA